MTDELDVIAILQERMPPFSKLLGIRHASSVSHPPQMQGLEEPGSIEVGILSLSGRTAVRPTEADR
jgi:hypothetical protein